MKLKPITSLSSADLEGKKVILRLDLDLPIQIDGQPSNLLRLERGLPVLKFLQAAGARTLIISHLGRDGSASLEPIIKVLNHSVLVEFVPAFSLALGRLAEVANGTVVATENIRRLPAEVANDGRWAKAVAASADLYVNEAFAVCHREHASIIQLPKFLPSYVGPALLDEVTNLSRMLKPELPLTVIVGGAKFGTKLPLLTKFLAPAQNIMVGGALAHVFLKQRGYEIGRSLVDESSTIPEVLINSPKILLPSEVVVKTADQKIINRHLAELLPTDTIVDVGPATVETWAKLIGASKTILWNGPLGYFEAGFAAGTKKLAELITASSAFSVVGGGDTIAAIDSPDLLAKFGFVSAAGGAMLQFLSAGTLPGLEALKS